MITLKDLESELSVAADILRGRVEPSDYTSYLSKLLLLKLLSDRFEEESEAIEIKSRDRNLARNTPDEHRFFIPEDSRWDNLLKQTRNIGEALNKAVEYVEYANPELEGIFTSTDFSKHTRFDSKRNDEALLDLIFYFKALNLKSSNLSEPDLPGKAYKFLIEKLAESEGKKGGAFATPSSLVELLVRLLDPQQGLSICDPTCGSAGILVEWANQIKQQGSDLHNVSLYGQEVNLETWAIAKINLLLHNFYNFDIRLGDTLRDPQLVQDGKLMLFDRIIANPPFNLNRWGDEIAKFDRYGRFFFGIPPKSNGDFAFIQHILATLNETGKAGVVVSPGVLFRGGTEGEIRQRMITTDLIEGVISLAPNLLYGAAISPAILIFNVKKPEKYKGKILFIDASREYQKGKGRNYLSEQDIAHIVSVYQAFQDQVGYAKVVSFEELTINNYNLNINRYIKPPKIKIDIQAEIIKLRKLEAELVEAESEMNECLRALGVDLGIEPR
jgi:type I restriction enzyme M protein